MSASAIIIKGLHYVRGKLHAALVVCNLKKKIEIVSRAINLKLLVFYCMTGNQLRKARALICTAAVQVQIKD